VTTWTIVKAGRCVGYVEAATKREATILAQRQFGNGVWVYERGSFS
jgi:hypothetical protein